MQMRWLAAGIAALLITGGGATVAQRVITQKTRGVLPEKDDSAHADSRPASHPTLAIASPDPSVVVATVAVQPVIIRDDQPTAPVETKLTLPMSPESPGAEPLVDPAPAPVVAEVPEATAGPKSVDALPAPADQAISPATGSVVAPVAAEAAPTPAPAPQEQAAAKLDPVDAVDSFVERNRKEAATAIESLSTEAENLKSRLAKVESALTRWQSFSRALNADQPASQTEVPTAGKPNWKRSGTDPVARPTQPAPAGDSPPVALEPTAEPMKADLPANPPLPMPADVPEPKPPTIDLPTQSLPDPPTATPPPGR